MIVIASSFVFAIIFVRVLVGIFNMVKYQLKLKEFNHLKQIYLYLLHYKNNPEKAMQFLDKKIKVEGKWLYSNNFYFDLEDDGIWERMRNYYMEYCNYFIWKENQNTFKEILSLKVA